MDVFITDSIADLDWNRFTEVEKIELHRSISELIELTDAMFVHQSSWIVDASKATDSNRDAIRIDASALNDLVG